MNIVRKDATITNTGPDDAFPGTFEVVLSTPAKDRDGDELAIEDWKQPLPEHITFDTDHGMSVATTVGSGVPSIEDGKLVVRGTYSSLPRAQEARTLVNEKHIRTTSVAFMSEKVTKDGKTRTVRELLNGAFVAIPSNREAVVLSAKAGARNSTADQAHIQAIYEHVVALGAGPMDDTGAEEGVMGGKSTKAPAPKHVGLSDARKAQFTADLKKDPPNSAVQIAAGMRRLSQWAASGHFPTGLNYADLHWLYDACAAELHRRDPKSNAGGHFPADGSGKSFDGAEVKCHALVTLLADVRDEAESGNAGKGLSGAQTKDAATLAQGVDAALDEACNLLRGCDTSTLPEPVAQALGLITAAAETVDQLLDAMNVDNPDEETTPPAEKSADADALELKCRVLTALSAAAS